jgi:hypothetical protein
MKNVGRTAVAGSVPVSDRFAGTQNRTIDLAPFLGDGGGVRVSKSVRAAAGNFTVHLTDEIKLDAQDSLYGLIEPMDVIEIRMAGDAYKNPTLPIMMRGFVGSVRRVQSMTMNGQPQRSVIITGHDYGKIWQILQIFYMPNVPSTGNLITSFPFYARFGITFNIEQMGTFVGEVFDKIVNPYIVNMGDIGGNADTSPLLEIQQDIQVLHGKVSPYGIGSWGGGSVYDLLSSFGDIKAWNELFIEDREDAPYVVYRPNPFKTADSKEFIQEIIEDEAPAVIDIDLTDVIGYDVGRSDDDVANYFWVDAPRFMLNYDETMRAFAYYGAPDTFFIQNYGNVDPKLYGTRKMQVSTDQGGDGESTNGNGTPDGAPRQDDRDALIGWMNERRLQLIAQNKDNVVFENGSFNLKGNENIRAGTYLRLTHGNMQSLYYVVAVNHDYKPFGHFMTSAQVERGTGFIDRAQQGSGLASPYWAEIAQP